jgi:Hydrolytic ATP binding site of dynein motor region
MGSIFSGLVQCGAWGCFDEFNRIEPEVLSVVSSQIKQIQEALKNSQSRFHFEGAIKRRTDGRRDGQTDRQTNRGRC